ncbi:hypothetical protein QSU92_01115 [Microbacterium sp. ET2]|uniref:hypothetical protein n=1 Tax=Microbacterium albipurpureum TaxID=3050384 RepID=UPI00259C86A7|nr:hypothetical protein [Microbacterium sp. ET2 (Ac-2212)]WJL95857.1 hypothetical protein QSU92_01115 [Microbacterium sp. ET2 (Ac-2212)]
MITNQSTVATIDEWAAAAIAVIEVEKERLLADPDFARRVDALEEPWTVDDLLAKTITADIPELPPLPAAGWVVESAIAAVSYCELTVQQDGVEVTLDGAQLQKQMTGTLDVITGKFQSLTCVRIARPGEGGVDIPLDSIPAVIDGLLSTGAQS